MSKADDNQAAVNQRAFVSMLVHELRTPLTALRGSLGLLAEEVKGAAPEVQSFAAIAARNAGKLVSMLDDTADYWRLHNSSATLTCEPTDIADTVQRAIEQVQPLIVERGVVLDVRASAVEANVDPALVRMAVARVLSYAVRVSPKGATLAVRIEAVSRAGAPGLEPSTEGGNLPSIAAGDVPDAPPPSSSRGKRGRAKTSVVVSISDAGRIIAADRVAQMFEPFSSVARRGVEPTMPTGLGLAIALKIARLHKGSLVFDQTEHGGLFSIQLPVRRRRPRQPRRRQTLPECLPAVTPSAITPE